MECGFSTKASMTTHFPKNELPERGRSRRFDDAVRSSFDLYIDLTLLLLLASLLSLAVTATNYLA